MHRAETPHILDRNGRPRETTKDIHSGGWGEWQLRRKNKDAAENVHRSAHIGHFLQIKSLGRTSSPPASIVLVVFQGAWLSAMSVIDPWMDERTNERTGPHLLLSCLCETLPPLPLPLVSSLATYDDDGGASLVPLLRHISISCTSPSACRVLFW